MNYKNKYYKYKLKYLTLKKIIGGTNPHDEAASDALVKITELAGAEAAVEEKAAELLAQTSKQNAKEKETAEIEIASISTGSDVSSIGQNVKDGESDRSVNRKSE